MATIPFEFEGLDTPYSGLDVCKSDGIVNVTWPLMRIVLCHNECYEEEFAQGFRLPPTERIRGVSADISVFKDFGFRIGNYAEFTVFEPWFGDPPERRAWARIGKVEASIGEPTPIMRYVFGHTLRLNDLLDGDWSNVHSIRLVGVSENSVEKGLLQALLTFRSRLAADSLDIGGVSDSEVDQLEEEVDVSEGSELCAPEFCGSDLEPLRMFHRAVSTVDAEFAFLQFYKILEYYCILNSADDLSRLRWDRSISSTEFMRTVLLSVSREERALLCRLIAKIASPSTTKLAVDLGLVSSCDSGKLGSAIYDFRNSIVHAKYDMRATMHSPSILDDSPSAGNWSRVARHLAIETLLQCGSPDR